ncbi:hypothetical protein [Caulobacter sp. DWR2-3-1b2]|uniref:hypothetical protein n=1 Tax=unclassified Caulobacter TaxID=2648921 RepID=UPI003CFA4158
MILGVSTATFTLIHVIISLIGIAAGLVALGGMLINRRLPGWTTGFLATTALTSVTGFFFHSKAIGPPRIVGVISLVVLAIAFWALYGSKLVGAWRPIYVITATIALYLNVFVGVAQSFRKIPPLHVLAPAGTEPPFAIAQGASLILLGGLGFLAVKRFRPVS